MTQTPEHHTAAGWSKRPRRIEEFTVESVKDNGDRLEIHMSTGWTFGRSKADLGREIMVGETLWQETIQLTDEDLAREAREFSEQMHRNDVVRLEKNRKSYSVGGAMSLSSADWPRCSMKAMRRGPSSCQASWVCRVTSGTAPRRSLRGASSMATNTPYWYRLASRQSPATPTTARRHKTRILGASVHHLDRRPVEDQIPPDRLSVRGADHQSQPPHLLDEVTGAVGVAEPTDCGRDVAGEHHAQLERHDVGASCATQRFDARWRVMTVVSSDQDGLAQGSVHSRRQLGHPD